MNIYSKTKIVLRKTEWIVLNKKKEPVGWFDEVIDKSIHQKIIDPAKLVKISATQLWESISLWSFIFFMILMILLLFLTGYYKYLSNYGQHVGTLFGSYAPLAICILAIISTYFLFAFRMPSFTEQSLVNEDMVDKVISVLSNEISSEKEADIIEKNIADLAEFSKRRKILIRIVSMAILTYLFKEAEGSFIGIGVSVTTIIAILFEMYALGSGAIFANAKYAVREIALEYNKAKNDENSNIN